MKPYNSKEFLALKAEIEAHKRLCGYYLIKFIDITDLRQAGKDQEEIAEEVFQYFDDQKWPPREQRPQDQAWADSVREPEVARKHALEALVGGGPVGHSRVTISQAQARRFLQRFEALFDEPKSYYIGMGFGNSQYVFLHGVAIISRSRAGLLWVVESD
jgi:hypothetical protein